MTLKPVSYTHLDVYKRQIHKWKYDDLAYKMSSKRIVGKIQPEKNKERSKYNFTIDIQGDNYTSVSYTHLANSGCEVR